MPDNEQSIKELAQARKTWIALSILCANWGVIFLMVFFAVRLGTWWSYLIGILCVGIEQHALGLWMHESAHWLLAKKRWLNDLIAYVFLTGPLLVPLATYRERHFAHHGYLGTPEDTKQIIFRSIRGFGLLRYFLETCFGLGFIKIASGYVFSRQARGARRVAWGTFALEGLWIVASQFSLFFFLWKLSGSAWTYLVFWIAPWLTVNRFVGGLRAISEHQPLGQERHPFARTMKPSWIERFIFCRAGFDFHWTHHHYPTVPCFQLSRIPREPADEARGYFATLLQLMLAPRA